jgi:hypothetical protein
MLMFSFALPLMQLLLIGPGWVGNIGGCYSGFFIGRGDLLFVCTLC